MAYLPKDIAKFFTDYREAYNAARRTVFSYSLSKMFPVVYLLKIADKPWYLSIKCGILKKDELIGGMFMTAEAAWDYAIGMIKVDGLEPTEDFKKYIELEKNGQATAEDLKKYLDKKYKVKQDA